MIWSHTGKLLSKASIWPTAVIVQDLFIAHTHTHTISLHYSRTNACLFTQVSKSAGDGLCLHQGTLILQYLLKYVIEGRERTLV